MMAARDPMEVLEAAYRVDGSDDEWLSGVLDAWTPLLDDGCGVCAYFADGSTPPLRLWGYQGRGLRAPHVKALIEGAHESHLQRLAYRLHFETSPCATASMASGLGKGIADVPQMREVFESTGAKDALGILAFDASRQGCVINVALRRARRVTAAEGASNLRLAAHVTAGLRLRRGGAHHATPEAVLGPDGRLLHAEVAASHSSTRDLLARGAAAVDRARGRMRREDPEGAVAIWQGLVAGRWSLVDQFDRDGRRFMVARANAPVPPGNDEPPLTLREKQVVGAASLGHPNKMIAYELGLSPSTVAKHLAQAARKLRAASRLELLARYRRSLLP